MRLHIWKHVFLMQLIIMMFKISGNQIAVSPCHLLILNCSYIQTQRVSWGDRKNVESVFRVIPLPTRFCPCPCELSQKGEQYFAYSFSGDDYLILTYCWSWNENCNSVFLRERATNEWFFVFINKHKKIWLQHCKRQGEWKEEPYKVQHIKKQKNASPPWPPYTIICS